jgi:hypothetical protein
MEVYQWLLRNNGFKTSSTGYFVYVNGKKDKEAFDGKLEFDVALIPYTGKDDWIEGVLRKIKACLMNPMIPEAGELCEYCSYRESAGKSLRNAYITGVSPEKKTAPDKPKKRSAKKDIRDSSEPSLNASLF